MQSKIFNGYPARQEEYKHVASLQLNDSHICSSGLFKERFLLTTGECAWYMGVGMKDNKEKGTAVFGDLDSKDGQRINIFKVAYHDEIKITNTMSMKYNYEIGVVMVSSLSNFKYLIK